MKNRTNLNQYIGQEARTKYKSINLYGTILEINESFASLYFWSDTVYKVKLKNIEIAEEVKCKTCGSMIKKYVPIKL